MKFFLLFLISCTSYENYKNDPLKFETKTFNVSKKEIFPLIITHLGSYPLKQADLDYGVIETDWVDYTLESNLTEVFDPTFAFQLSKVRYSIRIDEEYNLQGKEQTRVALKIYRLSQKNQVPGLREEPSDGVLEKIFFYRLKRMILLKKHFPIKEEKPRE